MTAKLPSACVPCDGGAKPLSREEARDYHSEHVADWTLDVGGEIPKLRRRYQLKDFRQALAWTNRVGMLAEELQHHPNIHITGWNNVELEFYTHAIGGLHANDFVAAKKIDELYARGIPS